MLSQEAKMPGLSERSKTLGELADEAWLTGSRDLWLEWMQAEVEAEGEEDARAWPDALSDAGVVVPDTLWRSPAEAECDALDELWEDLRSRVEAEYDALRDPREAWRSRAETESDAFHGEWEGEDDDGYIP